MIARVMCGGRRLLVLCLSSVLCACAEGLDKPSPHSTDTSVGGSEADVDTDSDTDTDTDADTDTDSDTDSDTDTDTDGDTDTDTDTGIEASVELELDVAADAKLVAEEACDACDVVGWMDVAGAGDVDGDGYGDVVVGLPGVDLDGEEGGAAYLVRGPVSGTMDLSSATARMIGADAEAAGYAVSSAGDTNGDGYADLIVGAPRFGLPSDAEGQAYLFLGPITGDIAVSTADATFHGEYVETGGEAAFSRTGSAVAGVGDVDGDGFDDVLIGAWSFGAYESGDGAAYLLRGPVSGPLELATEADVRLTGDGSNLGYDLAAAGDLDGDGLADVVIGQPLAESRQVLVFSGPLDGVTTSSHATATLSGTPDEAPGYATEGAGDLDGDGYDDLVVGVGGNSEIAYAAGAVYLVHGPIVGDVDLATADGKIVNDGAYQSFGGSVDGAGDVNGDGSADLIVGAPEAYFNGSGAAFVFYGPVFGTQTVGAAEFALRGADDDRAGFSVASGGDLDLDGLGDLIVGGPGDDDGGEEAGAAWLVLAAALADYR